MTPPPARQDHGPRNVSALLMTLGQERFTGTVTVAGVAGSPGGTLHLRDGLVRAVRTSAAPGAESVLLKSGRIGEEDWAAARAGLPADGSLAEVLAERGLITAAELRMVSMAVLFDGAFAMALSPAAGWTVEAAADEPPADVPDLAATPGEEPRRLTEETVRRLGVLRELVGAPREFAMTPVPLVPLVPLVPSVPSVPSAATGGADLKSSVSPAGPATNARCRDLLESVNGRRSPRDLAFLLGRGVFSVMLDLARLRAAGLLPYGTAAGTPLVAPRARPTEGATRAPDGTPLPRRTPGGQLPHLPPGRKPGEPGPSGQATDTAESLSRRIRSDLLAPPTRHGPDDEPSP